MIALLRYTFTLTITKTLQASDIQNRGNTYVRYIKFVSYRKLCRALFGGIYGWVDVE